MENFEYRQRRSQKLKGWDNSYNSKLVVNGNWIVGIKPLDPGMKAKFTGSWNQLFLLNRWTLELDEVSNLFF